MTEPTDLERTIELFEFLQGKVPEGMELDDVPQLTPDAAESVLYVLREHKSFKNWSIPDSIRRCDVPRCGEWFDSDSEGDYLGFGEPPYHFCSGCEDGTEYREKIREAAESMNSQARKIKEARRRLSEFMDRWDSLADNVLRPRCHMAQLRELIDETLGPE